MVASKKRPRADLLDHLLKFLKQHTQPEQPLLLGLSGGLDSCVLLDLLVRAREHLNFPLSAIHVNHGISSNAGDWAEFCRSLCKSLNVDFREVEVRVDRNSGLGLEAAAREARYRAFILAQGVVDILLGHHRDDQAETVLLQLLRGAGVHGLAAMPPVMLTSKDSRGKRLLRPLLEFSRQDLVEYAQGRKLVWITDESNFDGRYDRNFLRLDLFPQLEKRFPAASKNLARSARHLGEAAELLDEVATQDAMPAIAEGRLNLDALNALTVSRAKNLLRWWIRVQTGAAPSSATLQDVMKQLLAKSDAQVCISMGEFDLYRYRRWAYIETRVKPVKYMLQWAGEDVVMLPNSKRLVFKKVIGVGIANRFLREGVLTIRSRSGGEHFQPDHKRPRRSLKNLFQEAGVPPWQRAVIPLVYIDQHLVFVPGLGIEYDYCANKDELGVTIEWEH